MPVGHKRITTYDQILNCVGVEKLYKLFEVVVEQGVVFGHVADVKIQAQQSALELSARAKKPYR